MDIKDIRRHNLLLAIDIAGGREELAERAETSTSYISQCLSDTVQKSLGDKMARRIESALGLDQGWMDLPHEQMTGADGSADADVRVLLNQLTQDEKDDLHEFIYLMIRKRKIEDKYK